MASSEQGTGEPRKEPIPARHVRRIAHSVNLGASLKLSCHCCKNAQHRRKRLPHPAPSCQRPSPGLLLHCIHIDALMQRCASMVSSIVPRDMNSCASLAVLDLDLHGFTKNEIISMNAVSANSMNRPVAYRSIILSVVRGAVGDSVGVALPSAPCFTASCQSELSPGT